MILGFRQQLDAVDTVIGDESLATTGGTDPYGAKDGLNNSLPMGIASRWFSDHGISRTVSCNLLGFSSDLDASGAL